MLCELGWHAYRHVSLTRNRMLGIPYESANWDHKRRCKRCGHERTYLVFRYPRIRINKAIESKES